MVNIAASLAQLVHTEDAVVRLPRPRRSRRARVVPVVDSAVSRVFRFLKANKIDRLTLRALWTHDPPADAM